MSALVMTARIIPAYAGSTDLGSPPVRRRQDHPRLRGEHRSVRSGCVRPCGSSPPTRGAQANNWRLDAVTRIIPAYAGSTGAVRSHTWPLPGSSPPTRGARVPFVVTHGRSPDHPRLRGEHAPDVELVGIAYGSSPPTRGAPDPDHRAGTSRRIIPAYAGST